MGFEGLSKRSLGEQGREGELAFWRGLPALLEAHDHVEDAFEEVLQRVVDEGLASRAALAVPPDLWICGHWEARSLKRLVAQVLEEGRPRSQAALTAFPLSFKEKVYGVLVLCSSPVEEGFGAGLASTLARTTRLSRADREQVQLLDTVLEQMAEGVLVADPTGRFTFFNAQAEALLGSRPELKPDQWSEHYGTHQLDDKGELQPVPPDRVPMYRALQGERVDNEEFFLRRGGPESGVWLSISSRPLLDTDGRQLGGVSVCRDITALKLAQDQRKKLEAQLMVSDLMYSLGTLAAGVGHEINNPLSVVTMNLEMAARELAPGPLREMLTEARAAARRVSRIVRDLKMFSRPESEELDTVDLHDLLDSTLRMVSSEIRPRAVLEKVFAPGSPHVRAVESRLGQVFLNLLMNAAQAIPEGSPEANRVSLKTGVEEGWVSVTVEDTGTGIEPEIVNQIFAPFFTTKQVGTATGLGLSLSHQIVTGLGGTISLETKVGKGSTFMVRLPTVRAPKRDQASSPSGGEVAHGRILAVDDEMPVCRYLRRALSGEHEVDVCSDGLAALERIRQGHRYDVIISDLTMPRMNGVQLFQALQQEAPDQAERMIFLTGGAFTASARQFLEETENRVLYKPCRLEQLRAAVAERLRANQA